jgi:hypothetical protein
VRDAVARRGRRETRSCLGYLPPPIPPGRGAPVRGGPPVLPRELPTSLPQWSSGRAARSAWGGRIAELSRFSAVAASLDGRLRGELLAASPGDGQWKAGARLRKDRRVSRLPRESVCPVCVENRPQGTTAGRRAVLSLAHVEAGSAGGRQSMPPSRVPRMRGAGRVPCLRAS